jgi:LuxR family transcriptional regulator, quorum-sensing system regulator LasR
MHTLYLSDDIVEEMQRINTETDLLTRLCKTAEEFEVEHVLYGCVFNLGTQRSLTKIISNYPPSWREKYDIENYISVDPIMQHCARRLVPAVWSKLASSSHDQSNFMEEARGVGLASGISFPIHSREGDVGVLSFSSSKFDAFEQSNLQAPTAFMAYGCLLATLVHDTMRRIVNKPDNVMRSPLTPRELECLKWISVGKSSWEISLILRISEHGVLFHVKNIMSKFDTRTRNGAVLKAKACGLV